MFAATGSTIDRGDPIAVLGEHPVDRVEVVERHHERVARGALGHARRARDPERRDAAARRPSRAARRSARGSSPRTSGRGPVRCSRARGGSRSSPPRSRSRRAGPSRPTASRRRSARRARPRASVGAPNVVPRERRRPSRVDDLGARVPEQQRAPRLHEVDVAPAVGVDEVRALAPDDEPRGPAHGAERPHRRVHPAGDHAPGALEQLLGAGHERFRTTASRRRPSRGT